MKCTQCKHRFDGRTATALGEIGLRKVKERDQTPDPGVLAAMLTNVSIAYAQETSKFVASKIFNSVNVNHLSNKYHIFSKSDWLERPLIHCH